MDTTVFLLSTLVIFHLLKTSNAIRCYQCGSEAIFLDYDSSNPPSPSRKEQLENTAIALESCSNLESSFSSWGLYAVDCGPNQICAKTFIDDGQDSYGRHRGYFTASRGCAMRNTSYGKVHELGCGVQKTFVVPAVDFTPKKWDIICFCDTDYCNGSIKLCAIPSLVISIILLFALNYAF